jgi:WXG100 family type VII secretion target
MSGGYGYTEGAHAQASAHVRQVAQDLQTEITTLGNKLEGLQGQWAGKAASAFHNLHAQWNTDQQKLNSALENIAQLLDQAGSTYNAAEDQEHSTFNKIMGSLGAS